jgi:hypothetical protein
MIKFLFLLIFYAAVISAQPYIYERGHDTLYIKEVNFPLVSINRINLSNGKIKYGLGTSFSADIFLQNP